MDNFNTILEVRHSLGVARLELMLAAEKLRGESSFTNTVREIDSTVNDLTNATNQITDAINRYNVERL